MVVVVVGFAVFYLLHCTNVYEERRYAMKAAHLGAVNDWLRLDGYDVTGMVMTSCTASRRQLLPQISLRIHEGKLPATPS